MIIALSGYARAGKDTVAEILADHGYRRAAFADPLKQVLADLDPPLDSPHWTLAQLVARQG
ncbi:MAG TPA: hypothetical protein VFP61_11725, partial [Acidimicrobiales bacterium]|nr:hypothetical protein [Acidimicrobiales bacterium]